MGTESRPEMIRELVRIERVDQGETRRKQIPCFLVTANTVGDENLSRMVQVQTVNAWRASLCREAINSRALIWLTWHRGPYGKDMIGVELWRAS